MNSGFGGGGFVQQNQVGSGGFGQAAGGGFGQPAAGGFGQQNTGFGQQNTGFGQPTQGAGGFGQPTQGAGGFGQPTQGAAGFGQQNTGFGQQAAGGFGQAAGATGAYGQQGAGGFGQTGGANAAGFGQQNTGFGQQAAGGFGQGGATGAFGQQGPGGFGQAGRGATGGFGQGGATGAFGQQGAGGFGQAGRGTVGGFGQQATGTSAFGQAGAVGGGFGQQTTGTGGFGQAGAAGGGFGQQAGGISQAGRGATGGFGQTNTGFSQQTGGGFGQAGTAGAFGQQGPGGFGQAGRGTAGGFGQQATGTGGFGQAGAAGGGFGQQATGTGGFGQAGAAGGGFGQQATGTGGFGQAGAAGGGFGQQATGIGGFGQAGTAGGGFGQQATGAGGFGQAGAAGGGFGQQTTGAGGFGQAVAAGGGFGQQATGAGGFGQAGAAGGGFGQQATGTGGFGQAGAAGGGFGQPAGSVGGGFGQQGSSGFGQAGRGISFGTTSGGFGGSGGFGQIGGASTSAVVASVGTGANASASTMPFLNLPDFADKPYGNVLLFAPDEQPKRPPAAVPPATAATATIIPTSLSQYQQRMRAGTQAPNANVSLKQQPASFSVSGLSPEALRELISSPKVKLGVPDVTSDAVPPSPARALLGGSVVSTPDAAPHAPICTSSDYILDPPLRVLQEFTVQQLQGVHDFSVYRRDGKCSVRFLEPVNLVRCDVSDVLALRQNGEVKFYPDTAVPPPLGNGLHVRARVTVNGVVGMTAAELRERCHKEGIIFDSYDTTTGTWVYTANVDDGDLADEDGYLPEIERLSTYGESLDGVVYTPAPLDTSGWSQRATPVPPPPALHTKALPPASLARVSSRPDQSSVLPVRTHEVSVRGQVAHYDVSNETPAATDFELPYDLPDIHEAAPRERKGVLVMKEPHAETYAPVYVVEKERSKMYEVNASIVSQSTMAGLARSFRCGWLVGGCLAAPTFAWLRDGTEGKQVVEEVRGANVIVANPFFAHASRDHYLQSCAISVLRTVCRYLHLVEGTANHSDHFSLAAVNLSRQDSSVSLSKEKLRELVVAIDAVRSERVSEMEASTTRQAKTVLNLLDALYGLPEADKAESNAIAETRYLTQLRRRNLNAWLKGELSFMDTWAQEKLEMNATQQLLCKLLCRNLREAVPIAKAAGGAELSRVLGICGDGNQFGSYVKTADTDRLDADVNVRDRVVSLLSGIVEPFIAHPVYVRSRDGAAVAVVPLTATWKQLLGIFAFYGCTPDTSAEDIIDAFLERLRAPASRQENAFPPYADRIPQDMLNTARGQDFLARGDEFQDAALSILEGFAKGLAPASSALHPHASSYCATDYLTPFLILVAVRALKLQRTVAYRDAETKVLLGFTAALECLTESWFWALLPLHMIEDTICRKLAVESHLRRNAYRFKNSTCSSNADYKHIMELLKVDVLLLEPERPPEEARLEAPPNAPSIRTHTSLQDALSRFSRGFSTQ